MCLQFSFNIYISENMNKQFPSDITIQYHNESLPNGYTRRPNIFIIYSHNDYNIKRHTIKEKKGEKNASIYSIQQQNILKNTNGVVTNVKSQNRGTPQQSFCRVCSSY